MDISLVIPLYNEAESLPELTEWITRVMNANKFSYEILFINDGSTDNSWKVIEELSAKDEHIKGVKFRRNYGKSPALHVGFGRAEGDVVITMDADLQDSPDEIPELYRMVMEDGYDRAGRKNVMILYRKLFLRSCSMQRQEKLPEYICTILIVD